jgi:hypothetical protein
MEHQVTMGLYFLVGLVIAMLSESLHASRRRTESARAELAEANRGLKRGGIHLVRVSRPSRAASRH